MLFIKVTKILIINSHFKQSKGPHSVGSTVFPIYHVLKVYFSNRVDINVNISWSYC